MITSRDFRDTELVAIDISYNWATASHSAQLSVVDLAGVRREYKMSGMTEVALIDQFDCSAISHCTLQVSPGRVYLSLDPYEEGQESDRDNMVFIAASIERVSVGR